MNNYSHGLYLKPSELVRIVDIPKRLHYSEDEAFYFALKKDSTSAIEWDNKALYNKTNEVCGITVHMFYTTNPTEQDFLKRLPKPLLPYYYALDLGRQLMSQWFIWYDVFDVKGGRVRVNYDNGPDYSSIGCDDDGR